MIYADSSISTREGSASSRINGVGLMNYGEERQGVYFWIGNFIGGVGDPTGISRFYRFVNLVFKVRIVVGVLFVLWEKTRGRHKSCYIKMLVIAKNDDGIWWKNR